MTPKIGRIDAKNAPSGQPTPGPGADTDATMYAIIRIASIFFHSIENKSTYQAYPVYVYYGNSDGPQLCTLCCISLRRCCFGLETRVIIKISTQETLTDFIKDEAKKKF